MASVKAAEQRPSALNRAWDGIMLAVSTLVSLLVIAMTVAVVFEVVMRYFLTRPTIWVVDFVEYGMVYVTFFGAAAVLRANAHIRLDLLFEKLRPRPRLLVEVIIMLTIALVMAVFVWKGTESVWESYVRNQVNVRAWQVPRWIILLPIPLGALLMFVESLRQAAESMAAWVRHDESAIHRPIETGEGTLEEHPGI
jgi:C4-dicarboxylate transporter DctQ subunit